MTDEVKVLSDDEVGSIAAKKYLHIGQRDVTVAMDEVRNDIDSLCETVRALRNRLQNLESRWDANAAAARDAMEQSTALREQLAEARAENERLASQLREWQEEKDTKAGYL